MTAAPAKPKPCGFCRHLDSREINPGVSYCWRFFIWSGKDETIVEADGARCKGYEMADGEEPPGKVWFAGPEEGRKE